ncbi:YdcF family protein [Lapidilactobacillus luobeiensis]|uniref:YdcF family protein n=1 Tax=Lapidilactobacillus luobeiensis TaxID=2950371 RepID=UPI0021C364F9|nr:YdcF family protein [Lapidilactobacillus luobeiensis]
MAVANWLDQATLYTGLATLVLLGIFLWSWLAEPRRLINGILFTGFFVVFLLELAFLIFWTRNIVFITIMGFIFIILVFMIVLVLAFLWALLLWNAILVWKRESHTLSNMLTLFLGIGLVLLWVVNLVAVNRFLPNWLNMILTVLPFVGFYLVVCSYNFLVNTVLYQFVPRHYRADYLIVLGAGLIDGKTVSRLLGNRIERALRFAQKQQRKGRPAPKIIFSGGQGPDEQLSEAKAMADYAVAHGWDPRLVLLEDRSTTTLENMTFSKQLIQRDYHGSRSQPRVKFFTNNYHAFRAGLYARQAGLAANGVGAPTRLYFLPNALIREFVAILIMNKRRHFWILLTIAILIVGLAGLVYALNNSSGFQQTVVDFFKQINK